MNPRVRSPRYSTLLKDTRKTESPCQKAANSVILNQMLQAIGDKQNNKFEKLLSSFCIDLKKGIAEEAALDMPLLSWAVFSQNYYATNRILAQNSTFKSCGNFNVNSRNTQGMSPLIFAVMQNDLILTRLLVLHGADVNIKDRSGKSALTYATINSNLDMVKLLLEHSADSQAVDVNEKSSLYYATLNNDIPTIEFLVHGAKALWGAL